MSSVPLSAKRIAIIDAYKALVDTLQVLGSHLRVDAKNNLPCWIQQDTNNLQKTCDGIISIYQTVTRVKDIDPKESFTRFGLMAASDDTLLCVREVNECKAALKEAIKDLKQHQRAELVAGAFDAIRRAPIIREALLSAGLSQLHIKQSTRKIIVLPEMPLKISFTLSRRGHMVYRYTRDQAIRYANKRNNKAAVDTLSKLPEGSFVAHYRQRAPHVRANIIYVDRTKQPGRPDQVSAYMPILYPYDQQQSLSCGPVIHNGEQTLLKMTQEDIGRLPRNGKVDKNHPISESLKLYPYL
ncbi:MAG TPA: hypothetical protein ENI98_15030 [Gammaproteobacteria bacterium]|nr:hypothetical protein [Gammaproteobacteria bacterium]